MERDKIYITTTASSVVCFPCWFIVEIVLSFVEFRKESRYNNNSACVCLAIFSPQTLNSQAHCKCWLISVGMELGYHLP